MFTFIFFLKVLPFEIGQNFFQAHHQSGGKWLTSDERTSGEMDADSWSSSSTTEKSHVVVYRAAHIQAKCEGTGWLVHYVAFEF